MSPGVPSIVALLRRRAAEEPDATAFLFLADGEREELRLTYADLDRRARAVAAALQRRHGTEGARALLIYPPGVEFLAGFFGCLYAGAIAVPSYPPRGGRGQGRLESVARDAGASWALSTHALLARAARDGAGALAATAWLATDEVEDGAADDWREPEIGPETTALLQYTSGSTSTPKGVVVSHAHLLHNEEVIRRAFGQSAESVIVGWLPLFHDMGLMGTVLQPLFVGAPCILMSPLSFLQRPARWLQAISRYRATTSGGPNFAYDLCAAKVSEEERRGLDLSSWSVAFNGSEPVRAETLERFAAAFAPCGFRAESFYPCYGLAEATLFVAGGERAAAPVVAEVDALALGRHRALAPEVGRPVRRLVGCGRPWLGQQIAIADPET
ncbi:MAG TPA: fatty acyl-AMP ligase, partial [Solirubrobacterales bacterium]|nr:fatty acyl-AMP ligase [Solirubrobacterales bacterium]